MKFSLLCLSKVIPQFLFVYCLNSDIQLGIRHENARAYIGGLFNRPGVAGAVLQTALLLIN